MAIFVDYVMNKDREITLLIIREDNGREHTYSGEYITEAIELLCTPGHIVTWGRPSFYLEAALDPERHPILEDLPLKQRWFDIFSIIRADTGIEPSLTKTAQATLGFGPQSTVLDMPANYDLDPATLLTEQMFSRMNVLVELYNYIKTNSRISFYYKYEEREVEVSAIESSLLSE